MQSRRWAETALEAGVDVLVAQGTEGGGHTGAVGTLPLLQIVLELTETPVVAAGGIASGRGLAAVLAARRCGAWVGTPFLLAEEARNSSRARDRIAGSDETQTIYTSVYDRLQDKRWPAEFRGRALRNPFGERWTGREDELGEGSEAREAFRRGEGGRGLRRRPYLRRPVGRAPRHGPPRRLDRLEHRGAGGGASRPLVARTLVASALREPAFEHAIVRKRLEAEQGRVGHRAFRQEADELASADLDAARCGESTHPSTTATSGAASTSITLIDTCRRPFAGQLQPERLHAPHAAARLPERGRDRHGILDVAGLELDVERDQERAGSDQNRARPVDRAATARTPGRSSPTSTRRWSSAGPPRRKNAGRSPLSARAVEEHRQADLVPDAPPELEGDLPCAAVIPVAGERHDRNDVRRTHPRMDRRRGGADRSAPLRARCPPAAPRRDRPSVATIV